MAGIQFQQPDRKRTIGRGCTTRWLWVPLGCIYTLLVAAFGVGVRRRAGDNRALRMAGGFLVAYGITGLAWPLFPMHLREVLAAGGRTWSDTMHIAFPLFTVVLMLLAMGFGASSFGRGFRLYTLITIALLATFGGLTGTEAAQVDVNGVTPWIGVYERINIGVFLLWIVVLALKLQQRGTVHATSQRSVTSTAPSSQRSASIPCTPLRFGLPRKR